MAKETRSKPQGNQSITRHPLFPATVALWFGALFGIGSLVIRPTLLESIVTSLGLDAIIPAMAPPLGATARILVAVTLAIIGGFIGAKLARMIAGTGRPRHSRGSIGSVFGARKEPAAPRKRKLAIEDQPAAQNYGEHAPLPGARPQVFDVAEFDLDGFEAEMAASEADQSPDNSEAGEPEIILETEAEAEAEASDSLAAADEPLHFDEPAVADSPAPFAAPEAEQEPATARSGEFVAPEPEPVAAEEEEQQWPGVRKPMAFEVEETEEEAPSPELPRFDMHSDGLGKPTTVFGDEPARPLFESPREMSAAPQPAQVHGSLQPAAAGPFSSPGAAPENTIEPAHNPDFTAQPADASAPAPFAVPTEYSASQDREEAMEPLDFQPEKQDAPAFAAPFAMAGDSAQQDMKAQPAPFDSPDQFDESDAEREKPQAAMPEEFCATPTDPSEANADDARYEESELPATEELAATPIAEDTAAHRISHAAADELSNVELLERLALALERRKAGNPAVSAEPSMPAQAQSAKPVAQPAAIPTAFDPQAAVAPVLPQVPAALRPIAFDEDEMGDEDDSLASFLPPRHIGMTAAATPAEAEYNAGDEEQPERNPFARPEFSEFAQDAPDSAETDEDRALEDGYSSLLNLSRPAAGKGNGFVRIEEPEPVGEIEPMVVFPNQGAPAPAPFARPDSAATGAPFAGPPASSQETSAAQPETVTKAPAAPSAPPPFAPPAQAAAAQPAQPPFANPAGQADPEEAERALRSALANLQRMSGAA